MSAAKTRRELLVGMISLPISASISTKASTIGALAPLQFVSALPLGTSTAALLSSQEQIATDIFKTYGIPDILLIQKRGRI